MLSLVAGTCVGGGMLALPLETSPSGFLPSMVMMALTCIFMTITGLLFVEANLWMGPGAHIFTMTGRLLGTPGKIVAVILYLFISYCSMVAYTAGGGLLTGSAISFLSVLPVAKPVTSLLFALLFGCIILLGNRVVGRVNALLVIALVISYFLLIGAGIQEVDSTLLVRRNWIQGFYALPLLLTVFSYQAVVPSLVLYLNGDAQRLRKGIIGGTTVAFIIYALWQWLLLGVVPVEGEHGLAHALKEGIAATESFRFHVSREWIALTGEFFAFFAITTSFLGIGLGLFDFLVDGLKLRRTGVNRLWLTLLVIIPPYLVAITYRRAFVEALNATGGFGDTVLNGVIPALMVWSGRYVKGYTGTVMVRGGRLLLLGVIAGALFVLGVEIAQRVIGGFAPSEEMYMEEFLAPQLLEESQPT